MPCFRQVTRPFVTSKNRKYQHLKYNNTNSQYGSQISRTYLNNSAVGEHLCEPRPYVPRPTCRAVNPIEMFSKLLNRPQTSNHQLFVKASYLKPQKSDPLRQIWHETSVTVFTSEYQVWSLQNGVNQIRGVSIFHSFNPQTRFMT